MKTVIVVRHAKSSWDNMELTDHDRPLNKRGLKNAPEMAQHVKTKITKPSLLMTSSAVRAKETAIYFKDFLDIKEQNFTVNSALYHASSQGILHILASQSKDIKAIMLFGHNPGLTDLVNYVTNENIDNVPTCGVAVITFDITSWNEVKLTKGILTQYYYPKGI